MPISISRYISVIVTAFLCIPAYCDEYATRTITNNFNFSITIEPVLKSDKTNYEVSFVEFFDENMKSLGGIGATDKPGQYTMKSKIEILPKKTYTMKYHTHKLAFYHYWLFTYNQPNHTYHMFAKNDHGVFTKQETIEWTDVSGKPMLNTPTENYSNGNFTFGSLK